MAYKNKLVEQVKTHLSSEEEIIFSVRGVGLNNKNVLLSSTNKGLVLYSPRFTGYDIESFQYDKVTSLATGESFMGGNISFFVPGKKIFIKWIKDADFHNLVTSVKARLEQPTASIKSEVPPNASKKAENIPPIKRQQVSNAEKQIAWAVVISFALVAIAVYQSLNSASTVSRIPIAKNEIQATSSDNLNLHDATSTAEELKAKEIEDINFAKDQLKVRTLNLEEPFDSSMYRGDLAALESEVQLFGAYGSIYAQYAVNTDTGVKALAEIYKKKLVTLQKSEYPKLRKEYAVFANKQLWEKDIAVEVSGTGNKTITFTGAIFASNANIASTKTTLDGIFREFRFTRVNFKWSEYDTEYQYYDMKTLPDDELSTTY